MPASRGPIDARIVLPASVRHIKTLKIIQNDAVVAENAHICLHTCYLYRTVWCTVSTMVRTVVTDAVRISQ